jgi:hypothetical protein
VRVYCTTNRAKEEVREMKRIFMVFVSTAIMVAFVSSASAIDRAPKKSDSEGKKETTEISEMTKDKAKQKSRKSAFSEKTKRTIQSRKRTDGEQPEKAKARSKTKEKYDYFIDRNNNGIDDRLEKEAKAKKVKKPELPGKPEAARKGTSRPPVKVPAKTSPAPKPVKKVKEEKASPKKKVPNVKDGERKKERRTR